MAGKEVLLISPDPTYSRSVKLYLEREADIQVLVESDMARAIDVLNWTEFDAVICEHTPECDALKLVTGLRDHHFTTPFIIVHEPSMGEAMLTRSLSAGADHVVKKVANANEHLSLLIMLESAWVAKNRLDLALAQAELCERVIDHGAVIVLTLDGQMRVRFINDYALEFFGLETDAVLGRPAIGRIFPPTAPDGKDTLVKLSGWLGRDEVEDILPVLRKGSVERLSVRASSYSDGSGNGLVLYCFPVSETIRQVEGQSILDNITEAILSLDRELRITFINHEAERVLRRASRELIGRSYLDEFPQIKGTEMEEGLNEALAKKMTVQREFFLPSLKQWYEVRYYPHANGMNVIFRVTTERKEMEERLQQANSKLHLVADITRHDLMNQLILVDAQVQLAIDASDHDTAKGYLEKAKGTLRYMNEVLDFAKDYKKLGTSEPNWVRAEDMFRSAMNMFDLKGIEVECGIRDLELYVDPMMEKVFYNLLDNSMRHGKHVKSISITYQEAEPGMTLIYEDDGIGVSPEMKESVLDDRSARHGLRLVREVLRINGMDIRETGTYHKGARFEISLPRDRARRSPASF